MRRTMPIVPVAERRVAPELPPKAPPPQAALLPGDPERLAAVAARLGLRETKPDPTPEVETAEPRPVLRPAPTPKAALPPDEAAPTPEASEPASALALPALKPREAATADRIQPAPPEAPPVKPEPPQRDEPAVRAPDPAVLRPALPDRSELPTAPPRAEPSVRVEIGSLTLIARDPKGPSTGKAKSSLAPVTRRGPRGHSIPRPGGL
jgi:hypothetical protein